MHFSARAVLGILFLLATLTPVTFVRPILPTASARTLGDHHSMIATSGRGQAASATNPQAMQSVRSSSPSRFTCGTWSVVASPNVGSSDNVLSGIAAISASNIWAVGSDGQTLIEHWNGTSWSVVTSPNVGSSGNSLVGVTAVSTSNIWAVGDYSNSSNISQTLIEHWNGTSWSVVASPNVGSSTNVLSGIAAVSASNIWAVGYYYDSAISDDQTLIEHWNGTSWSVVASPNVGSRGNSLSGVARVPGSGKIWAVGYYLTSGFTLQTLTLHWNGTNWSVVASANVSSSSFNLLYGVTAVSTSNIWAVGFYLGSSGDQTLMLHWNGKKWSVVTSPNPGSGGNILYGVTAVSTSNIWAVGNYFASSSPDQTLTLQWNGTSWSVMASTNVGSSDNVLYGVTSVPGSSNIWAIGKYRSSSSSPYQTLIEFYC